MKTITNLEESSLHEESWPSFTKPVYKPESKQNRGEKEKSHKPGENGILI